MTDIFGLSGIFSSVLSLIQRYETKSVPIQEQLKLLTSQNEVILANQKQLNTISGEIMATLAQFEAALTRIDTATSNAATVLKEVRDRVAALEAEAGVSAADEASVLGRLDSVATSLEQMGKTPENPVPVDPEEENPEQPENPNPGQPV